VIAIPYPLPIVELTNFLHRGTEIVIRHRALPHHPINRTLNIQHHLTVN